MSTSPRARSSRARTLLLWTAVLWAAVLAGPASASAQVVGTVTDDTGAALPGVSVAIEGQSDTVAVTDAQGRFRLDAAPEGDGRARLTFSLLNFGTARREVEVTRTGPVQLDVTLSLTLNAEVVVTGHRTFTNLADVSDPSGSLIGIAQAASQGAVTARQLDLRPVMRAGELLETVPGVVISQHSGEGKANQYYLRGFNLDHGTDFATTVAGMPVNMPTHGHGHGYSDLNFLIPELVSGIQYSKGPYYADQGDFATAGAATINYANRLEHPIVELGGGAQDWGRVLLAASPAAGSGTALAALELLRNDGPWTRGDAYRRVNGVLRYSRGDAVNGISLTGMAYRASWLSSDQVPQRAVASGRIGRFGTVDLSDGGAAVRLSASADWQRTRAAAATRVTGYAIKSDLDLFSNFTFFLEDPERGDQFHQVDHRLVTGLRASHRRIQSWRRIRLQHTLGVQLRHDDIGRVGLYHTQARRHLDTVREDAVLQTSGGVYAQTEVEWTPWLRSLAGGRVDGYRFGVAATDRANGGLRSQGIVSPKGGLVIGPFRGTEVYLNGGWGFHSNDARGATITRDPRSGEAVAPVTPLVRARGGEAGLRSVVVPGLQSSLTVWALALESELVFVGDAGTTEPGRPSERWGIEWSNYLRPRAWLMLDGDVSWSRARFTNEDPAGRRIPGAVQMVVAAGATAEARRASGSLRLRYFGPRPLVEDDSVRSRATTLLNAQGSYRLTPSARLSMDVFNLAGTRANDVDYYYASRLPGEPDAGVDDLHSHPMLPRTVRVALSLGF